MIMDAISPLDLPIRYGVYFASEIEVPEGSVCALQCSDLDFDFWPVRYRPIFQLKNDGGG